MKTQYVRLDDLLVATALLLAPDQLSLLNQALFFTQERLHKFARDPDLGQSSDFGNPARIEILVPDRMNA